MNHTSHTPSNPGQRSNRRRSVAFISVGGLAVSAACAVAVISHNGAAPAASTSMERPAATASASDPTASPSPTRKPVKVGLEPALIAPFGAHTLRGFASTDAVGRVVRGHIVSVDYHVSDDNAHVVSTTYVVQPINKHGKSHGHAITVSETGGVVPMRAVRSDFEDKGLTLTPEQLDQPVDFSDGTAHPVVGDTTLVFLGHKTAGQYVAMARMTLNPATREFEWAGEAPNEEWSSTELTDEQVENQYGDLVEED